jgi:hypothetical protein
MEDYTGENRRKKERTPVETELLSVTIKPADTDEEIYGFLVDTSIYGIQISLPVEVTPDTTVELGITKKLDDGTWEVENLHGKVRWCNPDNFALGFNVGVELL